MRVAGWLWLAVGVAAAAADPPVPPAVDLAALPKLASGAPAYPPPLLAIGRTPDLIASPAGGGMNIQSDVGYLGGFSGLTDTATGQFGFPGYRNHSIVNFAFDAEKLVLQAHVPYPYGRKLRDDDVFELLLEPRDAAGHPRGPVYRAVGNAAGMVKLDLDEPAIGQPHRPWSPAGVRYAAMLWDPTGSWMASLALPFADLGGPPADGDCWGVQFAVRYADPPITAYLSPTDSFTDQKRFARLRFDFARRCNFRCHWLDESVKTGEFAMQHLLANGAAEPDTVQVQVRLYRGDKGFAAGQFDSTAAPHSTYFSQPGGQLRLRSQPAGAEAKDTVARLSVFDLGAGGALIYDQWVPYWRPPAGERDWLKAYFAKQFLFNIGPWPSLGRFDWEIDCRTLKEVVPAASAWRLTASRDGREVARDTGPLTAAAHPSGALDVGKMPDGAVYDLEAAILDAAGTVLATRHESFTRHVMPFETAPRPGLSDLVVPPFTPPVVDGPELACWGRRYRHGGGGLVEQITAAGQPLLARPAAIVARVGDGPAVTLTGDAPKLTARGRGQVDYHQTFSGAGLTLAVSGVFDYDGFYRFHCELAGAGADLRDLHLELPLAAARAVLIDAPVTWGHPGSERCRGLLDAARRGRLWDSLAYPLNDGRDRHSNMPPYFWLGDDERGLCYSCASDQGMANDDAKPAMTLDREADAVTARVSFVNRPLTLTAPRHFEFALQASPFKPMPASARLWRDTQRAAGPYRHGVYFTNFTGQGCYPTYGRWLTLDALREWSKSTGCDRNGVLASACSECGGTPEYRQFWHEWGSGLGWDKLNLGTVPGDIRQRFDQAHLPCDGYVMVEAASNTSPTNIDYRVWWFAQAAKEAGVSFTYQDNATWCYYDQPPAGYGYARDDGRREPTSAIWRSRDFMKRIATSLAEQGATDGPYVWPNIISPAVPGRSFCGKGLTGEYTNSDQLSLGLLRVFLSHQWGMVDDWLMQQPADAGSHTGTTRRYWRALCSRLLLLDVTNFSRDDTAEIARRWLHALDLFWLDDPQLVWHPYYAQPAPAETDRPTTLVSTYLAPGRALAVISNQAAEPVVTHVAVRGATARHWYDAETMEEIEVDADGRLALAIPPTDYRLALGFDQPSPFAAKLALGQPDLPAQSTLDAADTMTRLCRQLLTSRSLTPLPDAHRLTEAWAQHLLADVADGRYLDAAATAKVDLGAPGVGCALIAVPKRDAVLCAWYNAGDRGQVLAQSARDRLCALVGKKSAGYIIDPLLGFSEWSEVDLPAGSGRLEWWYPDSRDYYGPRRGGCSAGTMMGNILRAVEARRREREP